MLRRGKRRTGVRIEKQEARREKTTTRKETLTARENVLSRYPPRFILQYQKRPSVPGLLGPFEVETKKERRKERCTHQQSPIPPPVVRARRHSDDISRLEVELLVDGSGVVVEGFDCSDQNENGNETSQFSVSTRRPSHLPLPPSRLPPSTSRTRTNHRRSPASPPP